MSPTDINKLTAIAPIAGAASRPRADTSHQQRDIAKDRSGSTPKTGVKVELRNAAQTALQSSQPPVDYDRIARIKGALQDGSYPIVPSEIADAMIAARLMLGYGE